VLAFDLTGDFAGDTCVGYGQIGPSGFEEIVLRRTDGRADHSVRSRARTMSHSAFVG